MVLFPGLQLMFKYGGKTARKIIKDSGGIGKMMGMNRSEFNAAVKKSRNETKPEGPGSGPNGTTRPGAPPAPDDKAGQELQKLRSSKENYKAFNPSGKKDAFETYAKAVKSGDKATVLGALDKALDSAFSGLNLSAKEKNKRILSELGGGSKDSATAVLVPTDKNGNFKLHLKGNKNPFGTIETQDDGSFKFTKNDAWQTQQQAKPKETK